MYSMCWHLEFGSCTMSKLVAIHFLRIMSSFIDKKKHETFATRTEHVCGNGNPWRRITVHGEPYAVTCVVVVSA